MRLVDGFREDSNEEHEVNQYDMGTLASGDVQARCSAEMQSHQVFRLSGAPVA